MASTIKVNNIQNQCGANIANKCGTTITLGASGDTIQLACGASQTGFGRTGTVDWDTTAKTASFTAVSGNGYFVNTTSGAITVTLPAGSAGAIVSVQDYANTFDTNNLLIAPASGEKINGGAGNIGLSTQGQGLTLVYVDSTQGWRSVQDNVFDNVGSNYVAATGGTITTCGDWKIHTFTSPGTFTVTASGSPAGSTTADYLVVAGGGGGSPGQGGGGGAGGFRESSPAPGTDWTDSPLGNPGGALPVSVQAYPITVGAGGAVPGADQKASDGSNSIFSTITSTGGGAGGYRAGSPPTSNSGNSGGSGGGASGCAGSAGAGNTPPVSPPQGSNGALNSGPDGAASGGGGATDAGSVGGPGRGSPGGDGGDGATTNITGSPVVYAGGGGGGEGGPVGPRLGGTGGPGGGGDGSDANSPSPGSGTPGQAGTANTGGGGGGGGNNSAGNGREGGAGGSGIVVIRYKFQN